MYRYSKSQGAKVIIDMASPK